MPRKLNVVNLEPKEEENNDIEVVNEIVVEDVKVETKNEDVEPTPNVEIKEEEKPIIKEPEQQQKTKVKVSNLVACPRCNRYMKQNTLDFHHDKVCKMRGEEYVPKALKNTKLKAENIRHIVKEAIISIENERSKKAEKVEAVVKEESKPIEKTPERVSSVPPVRKLEPIQERPLYSQLRQERMEKKINMINSLKIF